MSKPAIVLVRGAFGDASSWRSVYDRLGGEHTTLAAALPLRGVASDAAYLGAVEGGPHNIGWTHPDEVNSALLEFIAASVTVAA